MAFGSLDMTLGWAQNLKEVLMFYKQMDVYAVVWISDWGKEMGSFRVRADRDGDGDGDARWNSQMQFKLPQAAVQANRLTLHFKLVCEHTSGDKAVGELSVPIRELLYRPAGQDHSVTYNLHIPKGALLTFSYNFQQETAPLPPPKPKPKNMSAFAFTSLPGNEQIAAPNGFGVEFFNRNKNKPSFGEQYFRVAGIPKVQPKKGSAHFFDNPKVDNRAQLLDHMVPLTAGANPFQRYGLGAPTQTDSLSTSHTPSSSSIYSQTQPTSSSPTWAQHSGTQHSPTQTTSSSATPQHNRTKPQKSNRK